MIALADIENTNASDVLDDHNDNDCDDCRYGKDCRYECRCKNGAKCDPTSGQVIKSITPSLLYESWSWSMMMVRTMMVWYIIMMIMMVQICQRYYLEFLIAVWWVSLFNHTALVSLVNYHPMMMMMMMININNICFHPTQPSENKAQATSQQLSIQLQTLLKTTITCPDFEVQFFFPCCLACHVNDRKEQS